MVLVRAGTASSLALSPLICPYPRELFLEAKGCGSL